MKLRIPDADLEIGDVAVHGEEVYPSEELVRVGGAAETAGAARAPDRAGLTGGREREPEKVPSEE